MTNPKERIEVCECDLTDDHGEAAQLRRRLDGAEAPPDLICARTVSEILGNGDGFWRSCSGCHELNEGYPTGRYSPALQCYLGLGCSECGGIGALWDTTDYADMAEWLAGELVADADREAAGASAQSVAQEPVAWRMVPTAPTPEMIGAWYRYKNGHHYHDEPAPTDRSDYGAYRAMLLAAPAHPATPAPVLPDLLLGAIADDEAAAWVTKNLTAIRRDNGNMDYSLKGVVRAFQAGKAAATPAPVEAICARCGSPGFGCYECTPAPVEAGLREAVQKAIDLLAERTHGSPARSPGHSARLVLEAALRVQSVPVGGLSQAALDVLAERERQISVEGWTADHDDDHDEGEIAAAAATYALSASDCLAAPVGGEGGEFDAGI